MTGNLSNQLAKKLAKTVRLFQKKLGCGVFSGALGHTEEHSTTAFKGVAACKLVYAASLAARKKGAVFVDCAFSAVTSTKQRSALYGITLHMFAADVMQGRNAHWRKLFTVPPPHSTSMRNLFQNRIAAL
jgi:hypothetical protein